MTVHRTYTIERNTDKPGRTLVVASTPTPDRYADIVQAPWRLEHFRANPVILWGHRADMPPIGRAEVDVVDGELMADITWDTGSELGANVARQFAEGFLSAVSVGFRPGARVARKSLHEDDPRRGEEGFVFLDNELLEISAVSIPANPEALAQRGLPTMALTSEQVQAEVRKLAQADAEFRNLMRGNLRDEMLRILRTDPEVRTILSTLDLSAPQASDEISRWLDAAVSEEAALGAAFDEWWTG